MGKGEDSEKEVVYDDISKGFADTRASPHPPQVKETTASGRPKRGASRHAKHEDKPPAEEDPAGDGELRGPTTPPVAFEDLLWTYRQEIPLARSPCPVQR